MSTILLSIGSNTYAKTNIDKAKRMLTYLFPDIIFSQPILSEPDDDRYKYLFRNVLASCDTEMLKEDVIDKIKQTERAVGRTPKDKYLGKVVIDIDLIKYGGEILRPEELEKEYVQQLLANFEIPEPEDATENIENEGEIPESEDSPEITADVGTSDSKDVSENPESVVDEDN